MQRPVVFNSLLTFVHNYRDNPNLEILIDEYFSKTAVSSAYEALAEHLGANNAIGVPEKLIPLYDQMSSKGTLPIFAASDLTNLPLALLGPDNDKNELLREMRQLKRFIHDALNGKIDDPTPSPRIAHEVPTPISRRDTSASSPEFPVLPTATAIAQISEPPKPLLASSPLAANSAITPPRTLIKRKNTSKSLDAAVKKLTDRQNKSEPRESTSPTEWQSNQMNVSLDPQAYLNMIRMMHTPQSSLFPLLGTNLVKEEKYDDSGELMLDDNDKHFEDSSPSPSEDIKEDFDISASDIDKPFICEHANCQKRFANKFLLKKHQFIHTGLRPHTCPFCNKRFNRKDNLLRHKKTHLQNGLSGEISRQQALNLFISDATGLSLDEPIDE